MPFLATTEKFVESMTHKGQFYTIDTMHRTCSCPAFQYQMGLCKHLKKELGKMGTVLPRKEFPEEI